MKKVKNIVIGGIQQKIFNLVLITVLLMMAAYTAVVIYQSQNLSVLAKETNDLQKQSITKLSQATMDSVLDASMTESTQLQAQITDKFFNELVVYRHSMAVATMEDIPFREHEFSLFPGDRVFVYTDGVTEATNSDKVLFGTDRMLAALNKDPDASPVQTLQNVMDSIHAFVGEAEQFDDITMMCIKYRGPKRS